MICRRETVLPNTHAFIPQIKHLLHMQRTNSFQNALANLLWRAQFPVERLERLALQTDHSLVWHLRGGLSQSASSQCSQLELKLSNSNSYANPSMKGFLIVALFIINIWFTILFVKKEIKISALYINQNIIHVKVWAHIYHQKFESNRHHKNRNMNKNSKKNKTCWNQKSCH